MNSRPQNHRNQESPEPASQLSRREFLASTGGAVVAGAATAVHARSYERIQGANDRIRVGVIGCGGMGTQHIRQFVGKNREFATQTNTDITAVCDIYEPRKKRAGELSGGKVFHDYRELIGSGLVDAVIVAAPEHWHYRMALEAVQAGLHLYLQKAMTRRFEEAKSLYQEVTKKGIVFQLGSQYMQTPAWWRARELYQQGRLGKITLCQTSYCRNSKEGEWNYSIDPDVEPGKNLDWKAFLGPLPWMEYDPEYYFRWRKYQPFSAGIITDILPHKIHTMSYVIGPRFPRKVTCVGGLYVHPDRNVPDTVAVTVQYEDCTMMVAGSTCNEIGLEDLVRGHHGNLYIGGNSVRLVPERTYADEFDAVEERLEPLSTDRHLLNLKEWLDCVRDRSKQPTWHVEAAYKVMTTIAMAEIAYFEGRTVSFDPEAQRIL